MANKLSEVQLWNATRTTEATLPETFKRAMQTQPSVSKELGKPWKMSFTLKANSKIATATSSDGYYLSKKKIIRLVYDDADFEEWRIARVQRQFSGEQPFRIECEPIWNDLASRNVRHTLSTGVVRSQVNFYGSTVNEILTALFGSSYNAPPLFQKGTIDATIGAKTPRLSFNGANFMQVLYEIANQTESEWDVSWNSGASAYDINFYQIGDLGGGQAEATDRPIIMGGGSGNRQNLLRSDSEEDYFSRLIPIAGNGTETRGIGGLLFGIDSSTFGGVYTEISLKDDYFPSANFGLLSGETLYFGVDGSWYEVDEIEPANKVHVIGDATALTKGMFSYGASKVQLAFLEDDDAVGEIGIVEKTYRRTDIAASDNIIKLQGISDNFSEFSGGVPVGTAKSGTPTVSEETSDEFVKFGSKSAKVVADTDEGLSWDVEIDNAEYPYFSLLTYLYVEAGSVKMEFEDSAGNLVPEGEFAETNEAFTQALSMEGAEPASGTATIRVVALEDTTTFYLDACVLTNTATAVPYQPLMGPHDLWKEAARHLNLYGGNQPDAYAGSCWDEAYFDASAKEIKIGSWVTVKDGWDGSTWNTNFEGRVIKLSYIDEFGKGRVQKEVQISNRTTGLDQFLNSNYLTTSGAQNMNDVPEVQAVQAIIQAIRDGNLEITRSGNIILTVDGKITNDDNDYTIDKDGIKFDYDTTFAQQKSISWGSLAAYITALNAGGGFLELFANSGVRLKQSDGSSGEQTPYQMDASAHFFSLLDFIVASNVVRLNNLPTSDPGTSGQLWNDSGTVKIS